MTHHSNPIPTEAAAAIEADALERAANKNEQAARSYELLESETPGEKVAYDNSAVALRLTAASIRSLKPRTDSRWQFVPEGNVVVPREPSEAMLHACQSAMKDFIRSLTPEDRKALGWKGSDTSKFGYRIKPYEKAKLRYRAMIAARDKP